MKILVVFAVNFFFRAVGCEYYSSTDKLREIFESESVVLRDLSEIYDKFREINDYLYGKLKPWYDEHVVAQDDVDTYITNPVNAFLLIKRSVHDVTILDRAVATFIEDVQAKLELIREKIVLDKREVTGAVAGLLRAQKTYHLKSEDIAEGIVDGTKTRESLTAHDLVTIADEAENMMPYEEKYFARSYFSIAMNKIQDDDIRNAEVNATKIAEKLSHLATQVMYDPYDEFYILEEDRRNNNAELMLTQKVCRGDLRQKSSETKNLRCRYSSTNHFTSIAPFKLEEANLDPYIVLYHDVFSDGEVDELIELARPIQKKALVGLVDSFASDHDRLAQLAWIYEGDSGFVDELTLRMQDMTGLSMKFPHSEALQIQNYGVGGHYYGHHDHDGRRVDNGAEDRIATLMLYLSNVERGGATAFPYLKLRVTPEKGSCVFWYNLKHSGHADPYTLHSGCPVLLGSKWVANKWIHNYGQELRKPCRAEKFEEKDDLLEMLRNFKEN